MATQQRIGLWMVGAWGGVGTTIALGLAALAEGRTGTTGLVTALPEWSELPLPAADQFILGGHDIRATNWLESAREFRRDSGAIDPDLIAAAAPRLESWSKNVRPGVRLGSNPTITKLGDWDAGVPPKSALEAVTRIRGELDAFQAEHKIDHLVVLNVSSTEPPFPITPTLESLAALNHIWDQPSDPPLLPSSALYALAALQKGDTYVNFTPSLGASFPAAVELGERTKAIWAGKDGKTGETLMKTVLAPMFAARNLHVMSWVGHNIFGNRDGVVLDDPINKSSKVATKDRVITDILGYKPRSLVTIEYVPDMGDWKTAWDHIHFQGFLGVPMTLQFTWQGCDSILAAPLAIDMVRLAHVEKLRGGHGLLRHFAPFFKSPEGVTEHDFFRQTDMFRAHYAQASDSRVQA